MARTLTAGSVAGALVILLASCSGGALKTSDGTASMTKSAYIVQANSICKGMNDAMDAIPEPGNDPTKFADAVDQVHNVIRDTAVKLRAVPMPPGEEVSLNAIYAKVDVLVKDLADYSSAVRAGDAPKINQLGAKVNADQDAANAASNAYGLTVCGS